MNGLKGYFTAMISAILQAILDIHAAIVARIRLANFVLYRAHFRRVCKSKIVAKSVHQLTTNVHHGILGSRRYFATPDPLQWSNEAFNQFLVDKCIVPIESILPLNFGENMHKRQRNAKRRNVFLTALVFAKPVGKFEAYKRARMSAKQVIRDRHASIRRVVTFAWFTEMFDRQVHSYRYATD